MRRDRVLQRLLMDEGYDVDLGRIRAVYSETEPGWLEYYANRRVTGDYAVEAYRRLSALVIQNLNVATNAIEVERLSDLLRDRHNEISSGIPLELYPDAEPVLTQLLASGFTLALVSNAPPDTSATVDELGLSRYFRHVVISGVVGFSKPNPEIFRIALAKASSKPQETVHIGDVYASDVVGARNAGISPILLDRDGTARAADCEKITTLEELPAILTRV